jgi:hypothetical protein
MVDMILQKFLESHGMDFTEHESRGSKLNPRRNDSRFDCSTKDKKARDISSNELPIQSANFGDCGQETRVVGE